MTSYLQLRNTTPNRQLNFKTTGDSNRIMIRAGPGCPGEPNGPNFLALFLILSSPVERLIRQRPLDRPLIWSNDDSWINESWWLRNVTHHSWWFWFVSFNNISQKCGRGSSTSADLWHTWDVLLSWFPGPYQYFFSTDAHWYNFERLIQDRTLSSEFMRRK